MDLKKFVEDINRRNISRKLDKEQMKINELYEREGLTDEVLEMQVELNSKRNELDLPDKSNFVFEGFVQ